MGGRAWTEAEIKLMRRNYDSMTAAELAVRLGRSKGSMVQKLKELDIKKRLKPAPDAKTTVKTCSGVATVRPHPAGRIITHVMR